jgi:hypothetical protein
MDQESVTYSESGNFQKVYSTPPLVANQPFFFSQVIETNYTYFPTFFGFGGFDFQNVFTNNIPITQDLKIWIINPSLNTDVISVQIGTDLLGEIRSIYASFIVIKY